ncbi:MAG: ACP S-malonyltransferase [Planctomycetes bacterium]|nr:ACP S-malonyltransferase [Planctomycetota bacterium]
MVRWVAMFPGVSGPGGGAPEVAQAISAAGATSEAGRIQVETYALSVAGYRALGAEPAAIAEHSMGIYAALTCAGVWTFEDGARATAAAARFLDEGPPGGVAVCVGLPLEKIEALCRASGTHLANDNSALQQAVGGPLDGLAKFEEAARAAGAYDVVRVPLRGAVHTPMQSEAAAKLFRWLDDVPLRPPQIPLINHVDAEWWTCEEMLRQHVAHALEKPVKWRQVAERLMREGYEVFVDVGPGDVLAKLVKWVRREARTASVSADFAAAVRAIQ